MGLLFLTAVLLSTRSTSAACSPMTPLCDCIVANCGTSFGWSRSASRCVSGATTEPEEIASCPNNAGGGNSDNIKVQCSTTKGDFTLAVHPSWSPIGAERFLDLVRAKFYDNNAIYRVVAGFIVQWGIAADPAVTAEWSRKGPLADDPNVGVATPVFKRGMISFAGSGPNSRTTQVFISFRDNANLGLPTSPWETPFGQIEAGMDVIDSFEAGYGDLEIFGGAGNVAPDPTRIRNEGNSWLNIYEYMDYFKTCTILNDPKAPPPTFPPAVVAPPTNYPFVVTSKTQQPAIPKSQPATLAQAVVGVDCITTKGTVSINVYPSWSPIGAERFLALVRDGFYDNAALYRVVSNFIVQWGFGADPADTKEWADKGTIPDDPDVGIASPLFKRGMMSFAGYGPESRGTQVFISFRDNPNLGHSPWETPFAQVSRGMDIVDQFYSGYGDLAVFQQPGNRAPDPDRLRTEGNSFLPAAFPNLDYVLKCHIPAETARAAAVDRAKNEETGWINPIPEGADKPASSSLASTSEVYNCRKVLCGKALELITSAGAREVVCTCHWSCVEAGTCCDGFESVCPRQVKLAKGGGVLKGKGKKKVVKKKVVKKGKGKKQAP